MTLLLRSHKGIYLNKPRISGPIQTGGLSLNMFPGTTGRSLGTLLHRTQSLTPEPHVLPDGYIVGVASAAP